MQVEEECQLNTVNEIATIVHDLLGMIQQESWLAASQLPEDKSSCQIRWNFLNQIIASFLHKKIKILGRAYNF